MWRASLLCRYENTGQSCQYFIALLRGKQYADRSIRNRANPARDIKKCCKISFSRNVQTPRQSQTGYKIPANDSRLWWHNTAWHVYARASVCIQNVCAIVVHCRRVAVWGEGGFAPVSFKTSRRTSHCRRSRSAKSRRNGKWVKRRLHEWTVLCSQGDYEIAAAACRVTQYSSGRMVFPSETRAFVFVN